MIAKLKKLVPLSIKHRALFVRHNLLSLVSDPKITPIRMRRLENEWRLTEPRTGSSILVQSFARWHRFKNGIEVQKQRIAAQYRVGETFSLRPDDRVIDIGANVGEFTLYAHDLGCEVLAIEADRGIASLLIRNVENCDRINVEMVPVWKDDEPVTFYSSPESADSSLIHPDAAVQATQRRMAFRLDTLAQRWFPGEAPIRLIKCDAEGAEPEVLEGASATLARTEWIAIDCGPERHGQPTVVECTEILSKAGFELIENPDSPRQVLLARNTRLATTKG